MIFSRGSFVSENFLTSQLDVGSVLIVVDFSYVTYYREMSPVSKLCLDFMKNCDNMIYSVI